MNLEIVNDEMPQEPSTEELWEQLCEEYGEERMAKWTRGMATIATAAANAGVTTAEAAAVLHRLMKEEGKDEKLDTE